MTVHPQDDLEYDKLILRTVVKGADQNLGVGALCEQSGQIRVGDPVEIIAQSSLSTTGRRRPDVSTD